MPKSLEERYDDIQGHVEYPGPFSHNISIILTEIDKNHGRAANKAIRDLGLNELGWEEQPE